VIKNHVSTANPAALLKIARPSWRGFRALWEVSKLTKVFALTSRRPPRDRRANRKATIACAAQRGFLARRKFSENRHERDHHVFFREHAREICAQKAKTEVNRLSPLQLRIAQKCARLRKSAHFCAPDGVRNRWQSAACKWCAGTCQRFLTPFLGTSVSDVTKPEAYASGSPKAPHARRSLNPALLPSRLEDRGCQGRQRQFDRKRPPVTGDVVGHRARSVPQVAPAVVG